MLGLFRPKCPIETAEKMWTEYRMRWLTGVLGLDRLRNTEVILPEPRFFPDAYSGTPEDARRVFDRVCGFMGLEPARYHFGVVDDEVMPDAVGLYYQEGMPRVLVAESRLGDPERLVATIAHELAHDILLAGGLVSRQEEDHEYLTDLVPVFLGLGLFTANAPVRDRSHTQLSIHYFKIDMQGYLTSRTLGYALSLFAYVRGEDKPGWARYLRPDAAVPFREGLRFLVKTGDSLFRPDAAEPPSAPPTEDEIVEGLSSASATVRAWFLVEVARLEVPPPSLLGPVVRRLSDQDSAVQIESFRTLTRFSEAAAAAFPKLILCLGSPSDRVRAYAAAALRDIGGLPEQAVPELQRLLEDPVPVVVDTAASGLHRFAAFAHAAVPQLVEAIRVREVDCLSSDILADALVAIDPPEGVLRGLLEHIESEIRRRVSRSIRSARARRGRQGETVDSTDPLAPSAEA